MAEFNYPPIAVVGVSALFPGSISTTGFWKNILEGQDLLSEVPESHWLIEDYYDPDPRTPDKIYANRGGFLPHVDFSPMEFGVPPNILPATDTAQLLALGVAKQVLEDAAGGDFSDMDRDKISVVMGVASATELVGHMSSRLQQPVWERALRSAGLPPEEVKQLSKRILDSYVPWQESTFPGLLGNVVAGRIANRLDLGGTNCVVDAACASSLAALEIGVNELYLGQSDLVITGGVDTLNDILMFMCFSKTTALSVSGDCRPFSDKADGTMLGEGIGMVALKRMEDAERDGNKIYAVLRGIGTSSDGRAKSIYAPVSKGQAKALRRAYERAGYGPETVELVEAHGTGTKAGDAAEFGSLRMVFDDVKDEKQWCALGSVKSQIGHAKAAAGAGGLFKTIMSLHNKVLPPTIKIDQPNPNLDIETSAFYLNTEAKPWIRDDAHPRRASVSSFGFGGTNFHVTLEEYTGPGKSAPRRRAMPGELFAFGANDVASLLKLVRATEKNVVDDATFAFAAFDSNRTFKASSNHRLLVVAEHPADLSTKLQRAIKSIEEAPNKSFTNPTGIAYGQGAAVDGKVAFLFPGQGSQYVNMGADLSIHIDAMRDSWDQVATLDKSNGEPLHRVVYPNPVFDQASRDAQHTYLTETQRAQPAIGAVSMGMKRWLNTLGLSADMVAGHSYGEVSALWASGVLNDSDFLAVSRKRGELMAQASKLPGSMTAVVTDLATLEPLLSQWNLDVVIANHNSPTQIVMSGSTSGIEALEQKLSEANITFKRLNVSTAFHSPIVSDSVKPFAAFLENIAFNEAKTTVFANSQAAVYASDAQGKRDILANQIASRVRFVEQTQALYDEGARIFIEVGPGHVLTNLTRRCLPKDAQCVLVSMDQKNQHGILAGFKALATLAAAGVEFDMSALWNGYETPVDPASIKKSPFIISLNGANYGKPNPREIEKLPSLVKQPLLTAPAKAASKPTKAAVAPKPRPTPVTAVAKPTPPAPKPAQPRSMTPMTQNTPKVSAPATTIKPDENTISAFHRLQQQTAATHQEYQRLMAQNHQAFLNMAQASFEQLMGQTPTTYTTSVTTAPAQTYTPAPIAAAPVAQPAPAPTVRPQPVVAKPQVAPTPAPKPVAAPKPTPKPVAKPVTKPAAPTKTAAPSVDMQKIMLDVVSEKTGYPTEMLDMSMELEADLGIDSIKRVEILSSMQERVPSLPEVDTNTMASLVTVQEIVDYMQGLAGIDDVSVTPTVPSTDAPVPAATNDAPDLMPIMLAVVSEKTGYPTEMLDMSMELEADLGIDSIKRVEILSSMQERVPSLPEVDTNTMASLVTVQEIVDYMQGLVGESSSNVQTPAATTQSVAPTSTAPSVDLLPIMLSVVSEKTGYPTEMLDMSMELEADLGIDSIKRVEILSSMQERVPSLPEVDTNTMASLVTVQEIVDYMQSLLGDAPTATTQSSAPVASTPAASEAQDLMPIMLDIVSEKTGYPTEMLDMSMELEADLGIDSIKRVEILSSMQERVPSLPEVDTNTMASLVTLKEIVDYMQGLLGKPQALQAAQPEAPTTTGQTTSTSNTSKAVLLDAMLDVVSEKTGYPKEMLDMSMELEADLGIDSIKRVEILSSMQERVPSLPEVDANTMASLVTVQEIVDYMSELVNSAGSASASSTSQTPAVTETAAKRTPLSTTHDVARYTVELVDAPETSFVLNGMAEAMTLEIIGDPNGIGTKLADLLNQSGWTTRVVHEGSGKAEGVIYLGGLAQTQSIEEEWQLQEDAFNLASVYAPIFEAADNGLFVTVQDTGGDFGLGGQAGQRAWRAGLPGLVKTLNQEWATVSAKAIDIDASNMDVDTVAEYIGNELIAGGPEIEVAINAQGKRQTLVGTSTKVSGEAITIDASDCIVVSGGARGVTASSIIELASQTQASFVLLGRSKIQEEPAAYHGIESETDLKRTALGVLRESGDKVTPKMIAETVRKILASREIQNTIDSIVQCGGRARYMAVDVRDVPSLTAAFDQVRAEWGSITGLVHGAGVLADALLTKKTLSQFQRVFLTKVDGLKALLDATAQDNLKMICMFSSVAARSGNVGQSDYAMANETLNKVAIAESVRRGSSCLVKSIGWGPWDAGMVTPGLKLLFEQRGIKLIGLADGARAFASEMQHDSGECELVLGGAVSEQGLYAPIPEGGISLKVFVHAQNQPFLKSHQIQGKVVLPVVLVMEWFARLAKSLWPDQTLVACEDMRVLRGIPLEHFDTDGHWLTLIAKLDTTQANTLSMMLVDEENRPRFSAKVVMGHTTLTPDTFKGVSHVTGQSPWPTTDALYADETLFHGPSFQVIESIEGFDENGVVSTLLGQKSAQWSGGPWLTNPALLDGALQLALLFGLKASGGQSLPLSVGRYTRYQGHIDGTVRCELAAVQVSNQKTVTDVRLVDQHDQLVADLRGVEMFVVPGGTAQG